MASSSNPDGQRRRGNSRSATHPPRIDTDSSTSPAMPIFVKDLTPTMSPRSLEPMVTLSSPSSIRTTRTSRSGSKSSGEITITGVQPSSPTVPPIPTSSSSSSSLISPTLSSSRLMQGSSSRHSDPVDSKSLLQPPKDDTKPQKPKAPPKKPASQLYGLHDRKTHPGYREAPTKINDYTCKLEAPNLMHWAKAPVFGSMPSHYFKAHTMTLIEETGMIWVFGGRMDRPGTHEGTGADEPLPAKGSIFRNVWCMDTSCLAWSHPQVKGESPPSLRAHTTVPWGNHKLLIFGGGSGVKRTPGPACFNDLWCFDTRLRTWSNLRNIVDQDRPMPKGRRGHTAVMYDDWMYVFGGGDGVGSLNDFWALDLRKPAKPKWEQIKFPDSRDSRRYPSPRGYHTCTMVKDKMIIIGGTADNQTYLDDVWMLDLADLSNRGSEVVSWIDLTPRLRHKRAFHASVLLGFKIFVFGGHDGMAFNNRLIAFNLVELQWEDVDSGGRRPGVCGYHTCIYADLRLWVLGGWDGNEAKQDLYILDLASQAFLPQVTNFEISTDREEEYD